MRTSSAKASHLLLGLSAIPLTAGLVRLVQLAIGKLDASHGRFEQAPWPVTLHIITATLFCVLGAIQLDAGWRRKAPVWHRRAGVIALLTGFVVSLTGGYMAATYAIPTTLQGPFLFVTRVAVSSGMFVSLVLAVRAIAQRRFVVHGAWMLRSYALGLGAGTQVLLFLPAELLLGGPIQGPPRDILMTVAWCINLAVAERLIFKASIRSLEV